MHHSRVGGMHRSVRVGGIHRSFLMIGEGDTSQHLERGRDTLQCSCLDLVWVEAFEEFINLDLEFLVNFSAHRQFLLDLKMAEHFWREFSAAKFPGHVAQLPRCSYTFSLPVDKRKI